MASFVALLCPLELVRQRRNSFHGVQNSYSASCLGPIPVADIRQPGAGEREDDLSSGRVGGWKGERADLQAAALDRQMGGLVGCLSGSFCLMQQGESCYSTYCASVRFWTPCSTCFEPHFCKSRKTQRAKLGVKCSLHSLSMLAQALWLFELVCTLCGWVLPGTRVSSGTGVRQGRGGIVSFFACLARRGGVHAGTPSSWAVSTPYPSWLKQTCTFPTATP